jgi:hypothetical protein
MKFSVTVRDGKISEICETIHFTTLALKMANAVNQNDFPGKEKLACKTLKEVTGQESAYYIDHFCSNAKPATALYVSEVLFLVEATFQAFVLAYNPPNVLVDGLYESSLVALTRR